MSVFNIEQNITGIPIKLLVKHLPAETDFTIGDSCVWIVEQTTFPATKTADPVTQTVKCGFTLVCNIFPDIQPIMEQFNDDFDDITIRDNGKTIPEQCGDVMNGYKPDKSTLEITPTKYFIAFNNTLFESFKGIYSGYCLRHNVGQRGYETSPDDIGYLHILFTNKEKHEIKIHWFYPLAVAREDK